MPGHSLLAPLGPTGATAESGPSSRDINALVAVAIATVTAAVTAEFAAHRHPDIEAPLTIAPTIVSTAVAMTALGT